MKRYHDSKEENKRRRRSKEFIHMTGYSSKCATEGRCHSKSPFDCGQPKCKICSKQRIDTKKDRMLSKNTVKRDIKEWES